MSDAPSWLTEDNINTASSAAKVVANNPAAAKAVTSAAGSRIPPPPPPSAAPKTPPPAPTSSGNDVESGYNANTSSGSSPSEFVIEEGLLKEMQKWHMFLRVGYMAAAIFMSAAAALSLNGQKDLGLAFFAIYVLFFSALLCCFECALNAVSRLIAVNFGFLYTLSGRATFLLFVGFMVFSLSLMGKIAMAALYAVGIFHIFLMFKFPRFEEYLRKKHYFEGKKTAN